MYTGVAIIAKRQNSHFYERTEVTFWELTEEEIDAYVASKEPLDKAGSYGIQGKGSFLFNIFKGTTIV